MTSYPDPLGFGPPVGLGTGSLSGEECKTVIRTALEAGYRHIDTAQAYGNEAAIGEAIAESSVEREDVVIATKVRSSDLAPEDVRASARTSAAALGVNVIDLLYVHWPAHEYDPEATLGAFASLRKAGTIRYIGLCNVTVGVLREAMEATDTPIATVQVEYHPLCQQADVRRLAQNADIGVVAHSPLAGGEATSLPAVRTVASRRDVTPAQVCLAWLLARDVVPIPGMAGDHLAENLSARAVELTAEDIARIDAVDRRERLFDYPFAPWNR